jgi:hypothetical protein
MLLKNQGPEARGGTMSCVDEQGCITKGLGLLAYPAQYGETGVMTFMCGPDGVVYQKNHGPSAELVSRKLTAVNPDFSWLPVRQGHAGRVVETCSHVPRFGRLMAHNGSFYSGVSNNLEHFLCSAPYRGQLCCLKIIVVARERFQKIEV